MADSSEKQTKTADSIAEGGIFGGYMRQLTELIESEEDKPKAAAWFFRQFGGEHGIAIFKLLSEIERISREMDSVINDFAGKDPLFVKVITVEHLATAMKLYVISWSTLLDLLAGLINEVFDLGIAEKDVKLQLVLNNRHVQPSRIPQIMREYEKSSVIKDLKKKRNDLVHRGKIPDADVEQMLRERNTVDSRRHSLLEINPISEEEHKKQRSLFQEKLSVQGKQKQEIWRKHFQQTSMMLSEIGRELARERFDLYKQVRPIISSEQGT